MATSYPDLSDKGGDPNLSYINITAVSILGILDP